MGEPKKFALGGAVATGVVLLALVLKVVSNERRRERIDRLSRGQSPFAPAEPARPEAPSLAEQRAAERADEEAAAKRRAEEERALQERRARAREEQQAKDAARAEQARREAAAREAELQAKANTKAAAATEAERARAEFERLSRAHELLLGALHATLERAFTAQGRERLRGGARAPWAGQGLSYARARYVVTCLPDPSAPGVSATAEVELRLSASFGAGSDPSAEAGLQVPDALTAAMNEHRRLEWKQGRGSRTVIKEPGRTLRTVRFFVGAPGPHEALQVDEQVSVTVPAGTFTGRHVKARHDGAEYELWYGGDDQPLPWRVLLPEERGVRPTLELAELHLGR